MNHETTSSGAGESAAANVPAPGLGDLSRFSTIITAVQTITATGDLAGAKTRIKDFEIAQDQNEKGLKPIDGTHWSLIDAATDAALTALRAGTPDPATVAETLAVLQNAIANPASVPQ